MVNRAEVAKQLVLQRQDHPRLSVCPSSMTILLQSRRESRSKYHDERMVHQGIVYFEDEGRVMNQVCRQPLAVGEARKQILAHSL